jgi:hypothetical protein
MYQENISQMEFEKFKIMLIIKPCQLSKMTTLVDYATFGFQHYLKFLTADVTNILKLEKY